MQDPWRYKNSSWKQSLPRSFCNLTLLEIQRLTKGNMGTEMSLVLKSVHGMNEIHRQQKSSKLLLKTVTRLIKRSWSRNFRDERWVNQLLQITLLLDDDLCPHCRILVLNGNWSRTRDVSAYPWVAKIVSVYFYINNRCCGFTCL